MRRSTLCWKGFNLRQISTAALLLVPLTTVGLAGTVLLTGCSGGSSHNTSIPANAFTVTPSTATVAVNGTQTFTASGDYATDGVTWHVQEGDRGGTVSSSGAYTAPATAGTYHIIATSVSHPNYSSTITVTVTGNSSPVVSVGLSPATSTVVFGATQSFTATVSNSTNQAVTWSIQEGDAGGSINSAGVYTAPSSAGTYHVVATSVADSTKSATVVVIVKAPIGVTVTPAQVTLVTSASQTFAATVSNTEDTSVTWSVLEGNTGGTITSKGIYTAPTTAGTYHIIVTSNADKSKTASAIVIIQNPPPTTGGDNVSVD